MSTTRTTTLRRAGVVAALAAADGVLSFRVPDEEDTASTIKVQVFLPTDHPALGVLVSPQGGWTANVTNTKLETPVKTDEGTRVHTMTMSTPQVRTESVERESREINVVCTICVAAS